MLGCTLRWGNSLLHTAVVRTLMEYEKQTRTHLVENGQGIEGTRNHAVCTTVEGSARVYSRIEDSGGGSSMNTAGKYMNISGVENTYSAWSQGYKKDI